MACGKNKCMFCLCVCTCRVMKTKLQTHTRMPQLCLCAHTPTQRNERIINGCAASVCTCIFLLHIAQQNPSLKMSDTQSIAPLRLPCSSPPSRMLAAADAAASHHLWSPCYIQCMRACRGVCAPGLLTLHTLTP